MLKQVYNLDIYDLNYSFHEHVALLSLPPDALPRYGLLIRILAFFWHLSDGLLHLAPLSLTLHLPRRSVLFFIYSVNQRNALYPVASKIPNGYLVGHHKVSVDARFPLFCAHIAALPFFPLVLVKFLMADGYRRQSFHYAFDQYWLTYGYYIIGTLWLRRLAPSAFVVSNDHIMPCRVLSKVAKELNIPTIYIQHASVNLTFPPLCFDYALLDGEDALQKYDDIGDSHTTVFLVGIPKMDMYIERANLEEEIKTIGICTNQLDPIQRVDNLCEHIRKDFPDLRLIIRPHPGDTKRFRLWRELAHRYQAGFSDSRSQLSFDFLKNVEVVIVGESNILLEAALMNVYPLQYDFVQQARDDYGFVQNGLSRYTSQPEQIIDQLRALSGSKPNVQMKAKRYCATLGTRYAGQSSTLAANLIHGISIGRKVLQGNWQTVSTFHLKAYEPASDSEEQLPL